MTKFESGIGDHVHPCVVDSTTFLPCPALGAMSVNFAECCSKTSGRNCLCFFSFSQNFSCYLGFVFWPR